MHCLFKVENEYDQPENTLVGVWSDTPGIQDVLNIIPEFDNVDCIRIRLGEHVYTESNVEFWIEEFDQSKLFWEPAN